MEQLIITNAQLEQYTTEFVSEFCVDNAETSKIIAGMTAIVNNHEAALEQMKNQKWFQRIWKTITGKNKATVQEMQAKRDILSKYTVMVIEKLLNMTSVNAQMSADLSYALSVACEQLIELENSVKQLAYKLNEKINSVDNFHQLITQIQNGKYSKKALLGLIEIMIQIDYRTASDLNKMKLLKETMETHGFDFTESFNAEKFADEILSMPEEEVGYIYLFCQKFPENRFLNYACRLIENYFYQIKTNREIVLSDGSAVRNAMIACRFTSQTPGKIELLYDDTVNLLPSTFVKIEEANIQKKITEYIKCPKFRIPFNLKVGIIGKKGAGKSTLSRCLKKVYGINAVSENGFVVNDIDKVNFVRILQKSIEKDHINRMIYCVNSSCNRIENYEKEIINSISEEYPDLVIVLTNCISQKSADDLYNTIFQMTQRKAICVLAERYETDAGIKEAYGLDLLVERLVKI